MGDEPKPGKETSGKQWRSDKWKHKDVLHLVGAAGVVFVTIKVGIPVLRGLGKLIFRRSPRNNDTPSSTARQASLAHASLNTQALDSWKVVEGPAPEVPSDYKLIASGELPCSVKEAYARFFSGQSNFFYKQHTEECEKQYEWTCQGWQPAVSPNPQGSPSNPDDSSVLSKTSQNVFDFVLGTASGAGGFTRTVTFTNPKKPPASVDSRCVVRQQFCVYPGDVLLFATCMNMLNIPFKECFTVNTCWRVSPTSSGCKVDIHLKVHFLKGCLVGGIIRASTFRDTTSFYKAFTANMIKAAAAGGPPPAAGAAGALAAQSAGSSRALPPMPSAAQLVDTMPLARQLKILLLFLFLVGSMVHQMSMHLNINDMKRMLENQGT